jgi:acetylornithine deacetylase/succinyl-diaminopimelate desuccinylase-like protein
MAEIDVRLLPDEMPRDFLERIRTAAGREVSVDVLLEGEPTPASPTDTPLYAQLERAMKKSEPASAVCPIVSAGTSDSRFFRTRNVVAYGISPFKVNYYDADTIHGADERIRASFFDDGVRLMRSIVSGFCAAQPQSAK